MRANIYIRKENEKVWEELQDKSDWVNLHLDERRTKGQSAESPPPSANTPTFKISSGAKKAVEEMKGYEYKLCKHGADPKLCKYAKPGKDCK